MHPTESAPKAGNQRSACHATSVTHRQVLPHSLWSYTALGRAPGSAGGNRCNDCHYSGCGPRNYPPGARPNRFGGRTFEMSWIHRLLRRHRWTLTWEGTTDDEELRIQEALQPGACWRWPRSPRMPVRRGGADYRPRRVQDGEPQLLSDNWVIMEECECGRMRRTRRWITMAPDTRRTGRQQEVNPSACGLMRPWRSFDA
jgi:hypothetical protein